MTATVEPGQPSDWEDTGPIPLYTRTSGDAAKWRDRGRIIADIIAERDEARAQVDRLGAALVATRDSRDRTVAKGITLAQSWQARAEAAEAEVRDLRAKVAAAWDEGFEAGTEHASAYTHGDNGPPDPPINPYPALASVGRTEPAPEAGGA